MSPILPRELHAALVRVVLGMVRNGRLTGDYRLMGRYATMKQHKGSGRAIIATTRKLSKIVWDMLHTDQPFDPVRMTNSRLCQVVKEMQAKAPAA